ncbi:Protein transport protein yif1 [Tilletia horrida]|uniref:Protein transport protein yif1 n=1 Tax=Tilletia horrida TaxID=155126 RepID=A0AAN6GCL9_9BASI|nr:Protein transport protein yif1 [Tilletia horrida]KAK0534153.1 Protein transport protein yif1 [Tilletia horrida]KAK0560114.1 Protein transport protein yif1 [Tilletia horrida]
MYQSGGAYSSRSPPPLQHPIPTHPPFQVPDPPATPSLPGSGGPSSTASPPHTHANIRGTDPHLSQARSRTGAGDHGGMASAGYMRFASPPPAQSQQQHQHFGAYGPGPDAYYSQHGGPGGAAGAGASGANAGPPGSGLAPALGNLGIPFPGFGANNVMNDATAQMGMQFGRHVAQVGGEYVERNFGSLVSMPLLKHYFNVSNSYVLHKLRIILFPWRHKPWSRAHRVGGPSSDPSGAYGASPGESNSGGSKREYGNGGYLPPREDVNSPDLYIPVMALVTYILITTVISGLESRFHPEMLGLTATRASAIVLLEVLAVKLGCYLLNIQGDHYTSLDLIAYSGYKFVGTLVTLFVGLTGLGSLMYWATFLYMFAANAFLILRSLRYVVLPDPSNPSSVTITHAQRSKRIQFLFGLAVAQIVLGWLLVVGIFKTSGTIKLAARKGAEAVSGSPLAQAAGLGGAAGGAAKLSVPRVGGAGGGGNPGGGAWRADSHPDLDRVPNAGRGAGMRNNRGWGRS